MNALLEISNWRTLSHRAAERLDAAARLEALRIELRAERISYGELVELQGLTEYIEPGDVELLEAAGVPEDANEDSPAWQLK